MPGSKLPIYTAFAANLAIAVIKLTAAAITGSSAMVSEGIHSLVDSSNEVLLLIGLHKSKKAPDQKRPFGYGKELYFWSFVVALLFFVLGGTMSVYEGIRHLIEPEKITSPVWNYIVLSLALVFDGYSLYTAVRIFNQQRGSTPFWQAIKVSKDPSSFVVLFEDMADVIGILIAATGIILSHIFNNPYIDGIASILIGLLLMLVTIFLVRQSRNLLMGESISAEELNKLVPLIEHNQNVSSADARLSMYLGPEEVILLIKIKFKNDLPSQKIVESIGSIRQAIQAEHPDYKHIHFEPV
ncbi:MAG: cation diffusion facilitator family transporter [Pedobacter sp.]|uniref:cation diffusion facilitator family transporter n=1 Tax=Pedobacter sp. TaxID=1411316 RepID=UPI003567F3BD